MCTLAILNWYINAYMTSFIAMELKYRNTNKQQAHNQLIYPEYIHVHLNYLILSSLSLSTSLRIPTHDSID